MSVLASAVGAILAAILESSVLTHLLVGGVKLDLVFAVGVAVAMVLGFEAGMTWAFAGGLMLDILMPERALGATALTLVIVTAMALLIARASWPPRTTAIVVSVAALGVVFQLLLLALLIVTSGVALAGLSVWDLVVVAVLDALVALPAVLAARALDLRFGEPERVAW
jgi:rod shape-determining protein MreD